MSIGERIRSERERLGMSQPQFASVAGTTKQTLFSWEAGKTFPNANQMAALAEIGVDVMYVLTGQRGSPAQPALSRREAALVDNYRHCAQEDQQAIDRVALNAAKTQPDLLNKKQDVKTAS